MKIAVVGSGIAGLGAAWLLSKRHDVVVFDRNAYFGGHSNTVTVDEAGRGVPIDTGFIVYNVAAYPNLVALFDALRVPTAETEMSFSVSLGAGAYEYCGDGLTGLFAQRRNIASPGHWMMVRDILRFFREVSALDTARMPPDLSLADWLALRGYGKSFIIRHILPMGAAIWSMPAERMLAFPMAAFARFFSNHGLLIPDVDSRPPWRTVRGGSREYVKRLMADSPAQFRADQAAVRVERVREGVSVATTEGNEHLFDSCVIATHADEALGLLADADDMERNLLGAFGYSTNQAVLHRDASMMPRRRRAWASWNYVGDGDAERLCVTYHMNRLQPLDTVRDYFVTLNPWRDIDPGTILRSMTYMHPIFDGAAMTAQQDLWALQGRRRIWFAGSYFGYGFHEDGLQSGLAVAEDLGGLERPWTVDGARDRILSPAARDGFERLDAAQ